MCLHHVFTEFMLGDQRCSAPHAKLHDTVRRSSDVVQVYFTNDAHKAMFAFTVILRCTGVFSDSDNTTVLTQQTPTPLPLVHRKASFLFLCPISLEDKSTMQD